MKELFEEAILMEKNVAELYLLFHQQLEEDASFWWELALEEENHAALLKTAREMMAMKNLAVPDDLLPDNLEDLKTSNALIREEYEVFRKTPSRNRAFQLALKIENSAGELHYDQFMHRTPDSRLRKVFFKLNGDDKDHARRIKEYMTRHGIPVGE